MKKIILCFFFAFIFFLCGCNDSELVIVEPSPTIAPTPIVTPSPSPEPDLNIGLLQISELMAKNHSTLTDEDGDFSDWIELVNCSDSDLSLSAWILRCENTEWALPDTSLEPGEKLILFASGKDRIDTELHTNFKLSTGERLEVLTPAGNVSHSAECSIDSSDISLALVDGQFTVCNYPSPGFENSGAGYDAWQNSLAPIGPLVINEVVVFNEPGSAQTEYAGYDWVEVKNISSEMINLADYYLSDKRNDYWLWQLPEKWLPPGDIAVLWCDKEVSGHSYFAPFELDSGSETLFLSNQDGPIDYTYLHDIPIAGSFGRMNGENGFFYFESCSAAQNNRDGYRRISQVPVSYTKDGVFNDSSSINVEIEAAGEIFYTLDGSLPNANSQRYTGPIKVDSTCVVRAVSIEEGALPSKALTLSFILNENHSLPVISLVADAPTELRRMFSRELKSYETAGSISFFEGDSSFSIDCGISITGYQSIILPKKSMKVNFRGAYGQDTLNYDVFGNGESTYGSLALRAGQDNHRSVFRQEIWQDLCLEMTDLVPTQNSKFCIIYLNGEYYGIYCLKENISAEYFANLEDVSKDSVEDMKIPDTMTNDFLENVVEFTLNNSLADPENYEYISSIIDIDSFIDWAIIQGVCANVDLFRNVRMFRSSEIDGKWKSVLFDLDHAMVDDYLDLFSFKNYLPPDNWPFMSLMGGSPFSSKMITPVFKGLLKNQEFRDQFLTRYAEVYDSYLSNEKILEKIDYYSQLLEPEIARDWEKWDTDPEDWYKYVEILRNVVTELDWQNYAKDSLCYHLNLSDEEIAHYFG